MEGFLATGWVARTWNRLVEPNNKKMSSAQRRKIRLLSTVLLILIPLGTLSVSIQLLLVPDFAPTFYSVMGAICILSLAYALVRKDFYIYAAVLAVTTVTIACFSALLFNQKEIFAYFYLLVPILLSGILISARAVIITSAINVPGLYDGV